MSEQRGEFDPIKHWESATEADRDQDPFLQKFEVEPPLEFNRGRATFELPEGIKPEDVVIEFYDGDGHQEGRGEMEEGARVVRGTDILEVKFRNNKVYIRGRKNGEVRFIPAQNPEEATSLEVSFPKMDGTQNDPKPDSEDPHVKILR